MKREVRMVGSVFMRMFAVDASSWFGVFIGIRFCWEGMVGMGCY